MNFVGVRFPLIRWLAVLGAAVLLAGCGSGSTSTITVGNESDVSSVPHVKGETTPSATPTTPAAATPTVKTPTSGPLAKKPVVSVPSGSAPAKLVIKDLIKGTGKEVTSPTQSVTVNYVGVLFKGGKEFDSSWKRSEPSTFSLAGVIPGWTRGIPGMKVGGRRELIIPASLAYGAKATSGIPANSPLVFVIDLLKA